MIAPEGLVQSSLGILLRNLLEKFRFGLLNRAKTLSEQRRYRNLFAGAPGRVNQRGAAHKYRLQYNTPYSRQSSQISVAV
ncbi:unnamed protein product [Gongylonema pulchrum]|uniref:Transposase n=1 Tax=Gongylonema pulchrum TaxID=637853 RepID=A0A183DR08_9BILA|nr:unnamed protein product [Gongylonema pulchrum]